MLFDLIKGYCLYKDGNLVPPSELPLAAQVTPTSAPPLPPPQQVATGSQGPMGVQQTTAAQTLDSNGQCCPQPNPISINITNSQDTNSRNLNTRQDAPMPVSVQPPQKIYVQSPPVQVPAPPKIVRLIRKEEPKVVYRDRVYVQPPVVKRYLQKVIEYVPTVQQVIKEGPTKIIYRTPTVVEAPPQNCIENFSPAFY